MKLVIRPALLALVCVLGMPGAPPNDVALTAVVEPAKDAPALVRLSLTNNTYESIELWETTPDLDFQFDVKDASGRPVERTALGKRDRRDWILGFRRLQIEPGGTHHWLLHLGAVFQLTAGHNYSVTVSRSIPRQEITGKWVSIKLQAQLKLTPMW